MNESIRVVRLASTPFEGGLWCGPDGLTLAGHALLKRTAAGFAPQPSSNLRDIFDAAYGRKSGLDAEGYLPGLAGIARSLNKGDLPFAMIGSRQIRRMR